MSRQVGWLAIVLCAWAGALKAEGWARDVWHVVAEGSPFFSSGDRLPGAGILQSDGRFVLIVLGSDSQGGVVSVNLPGVQVVPELRSALIMPRGNLLTRKINGPQLIASRAVDGTSVTYSFRIDPADIELFMAARQWRVEDGNGVYTLSLKGSRKALSSAMALRDAVINH